MVPLTVGFFLSGPLSGRLADRHGPRPFATIGLILTGLSLIGLAVLPINFSYPIFAFLILLVGFSMGMFAAPNTSAVMNSLPEHQRGAGSGMLNTFQNSAAVLSIGFFFTVITIGLASKLPQALVKGLTAQGVPHGAAVVASHVPPIGSLFAAFLGINPLKEIVSPSVLASSAVHTRVLLSHGFFPGLISAPFAHGLRLAFMLAALFCFIGAVFSWLRGAGQSRVFHSMSDDVEVGLSGAGDIAMSDVGAASSGAYLDPEPPEHHPSPQDDVNVTR